MSWRDRRSRPDERDPRDERDEDNDDSAALDESEFPDDADTDDGDEPAEVPCPYCGEMISEDAERCPACGSYISKEDARPRVPAWAVVIVIALLVAILIVWIVGR